MAEKVTTMVAKVDLQCPCCYKEVKKLLCKFPQIRNQIIDEKQNTVTITVVCCSPEKIRDKLCCKGGKTIKCIQIVEPPKPKPPKKTEDPKSPPPLKEDSPPPPPPPSSPKKDSPPPPPPKEDPAPVLVAVCCGPCSEGRAGGPCYHGYGTTPNPTVPVCPPVHQRGGPARVCCGPCSEGRAGGPCYHGYGRPVPVPVSTPNPTVPVCPPIHQRGGPAGVCCGPCSEGRAGGPCYHGYGRPVSCYDGYYGYGGGRVCHVSRCDDYFSEENATGCTIM